MFVKLRKAAAVLAAAAVIPACPNVDAQDTVLAMTTDNFYLKAGSHLSSVPMIDDENGRTANCRSSEYLLTKNRISLDGADKVTLQISYDYNSAGEVEFGIGFTDEPVLVAADSGEYSEYSQFAAIEPQATVSKTRDELKNGSEVVIDISGLGVSGEKYMQISAVNDQQWVPCIGAVSLSYDDTGRKMQYDFNSYSYAVGGQVKICDDEIDSMRYNPAICFKDVDISGIMAVEIYGGSSLADVEVYADMNENITSDGYEDPENRRYSGTVSGGALLGKKTISTGGYSSYEKNIIAFTGEAEGGVCDLYFVFKSSGWAGNYKYFRLIDSDEELVNDTPLSFNNIFADNMLIQRGEPFVVKGYSKPGANITVTLSGTDSGGAAVAEVKDTVSSEYDSAAPLDPAEWSVVFDAKEAGGSYCLSVSSGEEAAEIENIVFGDLFILCGQSNIERRMVEMGDTKYALDSGEEDQNAENRNIRVFNMYKSGTDGSSSPEEQPPVNSWYMMTKENAYNTSAIGYYISQIINRDNGVPVGIISTAVGGTRIALWEEGGALYNNRVYPFRDTKIKAVIYYQGESDADAEPKLSAAEYGYRMAQLIDSYRKLWKDETLPFCYVQLMRLQEWEYNGREYDLSDIREGQSLALDIAATRENLHLIPTLDMTGSYERYSPGIAESKFTGNARTDIHPQGKKEIAERICRCLENDLYGGENLVDYPEYESMTKDGSRLVLNYRATGELKLLPAERYSDWYTETYLSESGADTSLACEFELAGADGIYYPAKAELAGSSVILSSEAVTDPVMFRYAHSAYPELPNLTDESGLPSVTVSDSISTKSIVCIGDSITAGFGISDQSKSYPSVLGQLVSDGSMNGYDVYNMGKSGRCVLSKGYAPYTDEDVFISALEKNADIYVIMLGTNDAQYRNYVYADEFEADYSRLIHAVRAFNPDSEIYIASPIPVIKKYDSSDPGNINCDYVNEIAEKIRALSERENCMLIDMNKELAPDTAYYQSDGIHPNAAGAELIAEIVYSYISRGQTPIQETDTFRIIRNQSDEGLSFTVTNKSGERQEAVLITASYSEGKLMALSVSEEKGIAAGESEIFETELPESDEYSVMMWSSLQKAVPLAECMKNIQI